MLNYLLTILILIGMKLNAQVSGDTISTKPTRYLLPDGRELPGNKLDSLENEWEKGRITLRHNDEDDEQGIVRLIRMTDQMKEEMKNRQEQRKQSLLSLLNTAAPDFELNDLQGKRWSLKSLQGKIVVLNFWFTTCIPCIHEMPDLNTLTTSYKKEEVVFLGLTFNTADQVRKFLKKYTFNYVLLPGSAEVDQQYKVSEWPISMVIDRNGKIKRIMQSGESIKVELDLAIKSVM